jgi:hypothetical protein
MFVSSVYRLVPGGAIVLQALPFVLSHGSQNQSIIEEVRINRMNQKSTSLFNELTISDPKL